ncbi:MAG: amidase [Pseudomonadota bacterium]
MSAEAPGATETRLIEVLARIAAENAQSRIFLDLDAEGARASARASDARAPIGPLDGKIIAVKANRAVQGLPWSAGTAGWQHRLATRDAGAVARLREAGAIILGTVNMDEGALGAVCDNPVFGRCLNPRDPGRTPGGSSGGSAAAIAAGLADLALGTDTMGSVRIPAAYCGVVGLKPSRGVIGRSGLAYLSPSLDHVGLLGPDARALDDALQVLAGRDALDPESNGIALTDPQPGSVAQPLAGVRFGLPHLPGGFDPADAGLARWCSAARSLGATIVEADLTGWDPGPSRRAGLLLAEAEGAVALADLLAQPGALSPGFAAALRYGRDAPSAKLVAALAQIRAAAAAAQRGLKGRDALVLPTAPQGAFPHGDPVPSNQADLTALANFAGLPALSIPVPDPDGGLPGAVQLIGPAFSDRKLIGWAAALQDALHT